MYMLRGNRFLVAGTLLVLWLAGCHRPVLRPEPSPAPTPALEARQLTRLGRPGEAMERLARLLQENPRDLAVQRWYVEAARAAGRLDQAERRYRRLEKKSRLRGLANYGLAMVEAARGPGHLEPALDRFRQAAGLLPEAADIPYRMGLLYLLAGRNQEALAAFARAMQLDGQQPAYRVARAEVLSRLGRDGEAMELLRPVLDMQPEQPVVQRARTVAARIYDPTRDSDPEVVTDLRKVMDLLTRDYVQQALQLANKVLDRFPRDALALTLKGLAHSRLLNNGEAVAALEAALASQPGNPSALVGLGDIYFRLERFGKARRYYEQAAELNPFDPEVHQRLGELASARREHQLAAQSFARLVMLQPRVLQNRYRYALELYSANHWHQAIDVYRGILEEKPDDLESLVRLGSLHLLLSRREAARKKHHLQQAARYLRRAREINPENQAIKEMLQQVEK